MKSIDKKNSTNKNKYKTGEDIDMLRENNYERNQDETSFDYNVCDKSEDGA